MLNVDFVVYQDKGIKVRVGFSYLWGSVWVILVSVVFLEGGIRGFG